MAKNHIKGVATQALGALILIAFDIVGEILSAVT